MEKSMTTSLTIDSSYLPLLPGLVILGAGLGAGAGIGLTVVDLGFSPANHRTAVRADEPVAA
jgi:hypothetical protein